MKKILYLLFVSAILVGCTKNEPSNNSSSTSTSKAKITITSASASYTTLYGGAARVYVDILVTGVTLDEVDKIWYNVSKTSEVSDTGSYGTLKGSLSGSASKGIVYVSKGTKLYIQAFVRTKDGKKSYSSVKQVTV